MSLTKALLLILSSKASSSVQNGNFKMPLGIGALCCLMESTQIVRFLSKPSHNPLVLNKSCLQGVRRLAVRKDIERILGVVQERCAFLVTPSRLWIMDENEIHDIVKVSVIIHNMIVRESGITPESDVEFDRTEIVAQDVENCLLLSRISRKLNAIRVEKKHAKLKTQLVDNMWKLKGNEMDTY